MTPGRCVFTFTVLARPVSTPGMPGYPHFVATPLSTCHTTMPPVGFLIVLSPFMYMGSMPASNDAYWRFSIR